MLYIYIHRVIMCWFWPIRSAYDTNIGSNMFQTLVHAIGIPGIDLGQHVGEGRGQGLTHLALLGPGAVASKNLVMKKSGTWLGHLIPFSRSFSRVLNLSNFRSTRMTASKSALQPGGPPLFFTSFDGCEAVLVSLRRLKFSARWQLSGRPLGDDWQCWAGWKNHRKTQGNMF